MTSMVESGPSSTVGIGNTTMETLAVSTKQLALSVAVTVYNVLVVGVACGEALFGSLKPVEGCHEYRSLPDANNCTDSPRQIVSPGLTWRGSRRCTFTNTESLLVHPYSLAPVTA